MLFRSAAELAVRSGHAISPMRELTAGLSITPTLTLLRPLARGGMAAVWLAEHRSLRAEVVVKFLKGERADDPITLERFSREAAAAAKVRSPHVVQIFDYGVTTDGVPFIVMERLEGRDLGEHLAARRRLSIDEVLEILRQTSLALSATHSRGIVHRDIKPANAFLCDAGDGSLFVKLLDFGLAKGIGQTLSPSGSTTTFGTVEYMSPEQTMGDRNLDLRSDLWSLGVMTFELLTGVRPFRGPTMHAILHAIHQRPMPRPTEIDRALPRGLDDWFARACARNPEMRFESAREMLDAFAVAVGRKLAPVPLVLAANTPVPEADPFA